MHVLLESRQYRIREQKRRHINRVCRRVMPRIILPKRNHRRGGAVLWPSQLIRENPREQTSNNDAHDEPPAAPDDCERVLKIMIHL